MVIAGKFHPKKLYEEVKFWEKKIVDSRKGSQVWSQNRENDQFGITDGIFFFVEKKVDYSFFWGEIYRRLP